MKINEFFFLKSSIVSLKTSTISFILLITIHFFVINVVDQRKLEEKRARAAERMRNEVAVAKQKAEERRAEAEGRRKEKGGKVMEIASIFKVFGRVPSKRRSFFKP